MIQWQFLLGTMFIGFMVFVVWAASHGWFSKKIPKPPPSSTQKPTTNLFPCADIERERDRLELLTIDLQNQVRILKGKDADSQRSLSNLMDIINRLTLEKDSIQKNNATLQAALKVSSEELGRCRSLLSKYVSENIARRTTSQVCSLQPENANLIR